MLNLTQEERQVVLFFIAMAFLGLGANFAAKSNSRLKSVVTADKNIAKINLNLVKAEDLLHNPSLSSKLAKKILDYRDLRGSISDLEEIKELKGVSPKTYNKLRELFFVE